MKALETAFGGTDQADHVVATTIPGKVRRLFVVCLITLLLPLQVESQYDARWVY